MARTIGISGVMSNSYSVFERPHFSFPRCIDL
jgi:hypothetical protein